MSNQDRIKKLEQQREQINARLQRERAKAARKKRRDQNQLKYAVGGVVLDMLATDPALASRVRERLTREIDLQRFNERFPPDQGET